MDEGGVRELLHMVFQGVRDHQLIPSELTRDYDARYLANNVRHLSRLAGLDESDTQQRLQRRFIKGANFVTAALWKISPTYAV